jgi:nicotinate dehydrogenase subunit A
MVNGRAVETSLPRLTPLLAFLRNDLALNGPKFGCGLGECGACGVLIDGRLARACVLTLGDIAGRAVTTLEGLGSGDRLDPVQQAFIACDAAQCGYCLNGMIMTARALIDANPDPTEAEIREALRFNLCRCGAHVEIVAAVRLAATMARA